MTLKMEPVLGKPHGMREKKMIVILFCFVADDVSLLVQARWSFWPGFHSSEIVHRRLIEVFDARETGGYDYLWINSFAEDYLRVNLLWSLLVNTRRDRLLWAGGTLWVKMWMLCADSSGSNQINRVINHPTMPITITAHEDRHIRFFDNNTGQFLCL